MTNHAAPKTAKWPFLLGDLLLLGTAVWIATTASRPLGPWQTASIVAAVAIGAWMFIQPFLRDHEAESDLEELNRLSGAAAQINKVEEAADRIGRASENWQNIQTTAGQTLASIQAISDHMTKEAREFQQFMQRSGDAEKAVLRMEVEKLRRVEGEWLQVTVRMLDHVFALFAGAQRSGQPALVEQIGNFQNACVDSARRIGLSPFAAKRGDAFEEKKHRTVDGSKPEPGALVADTLAPGFTFQGQVLRPAIVALWVGQPDPTPLATAAAPATEDPTDFEEPIEELTAELSEKTEEPGFTVDPESESAEPQPEPVAERGTDPAEEAAPTEEPVKPASSEPPASGTQSLLL